MRFDRTLSSMNRLKEKKSSDVTVLDVFNLFHDVCDDIRSSVGKGVAELPLGDSGSVTTKMSWFGRTILKINKDNSSDINSSGDRARRFQDVCNEISAVTDEIENAENLFQNNKARHAELNEKVTKLKEIKQADYEIIEKCRQLEELITEYGSVKTAELNSKHKELSRELDEKQRVYYAQKTEYNELERRYEQLLSEEEIQNKKTSEKNSEIKAVTNSLTTLKEKYSELTEGIKLVNNKCSQLSGKISELENELTDYNSMKIPQLKEKSENLISEINRYKSIYREECSKCSNLETQLNTLYSDENAKKNEIAEKEIEIADLKNNLSALFQKNNTLAEEITTIKTNYSTLYESVSAQERELADYNSIKIPELMGRSEDLKREIDRRKFIYVDNEEKFNNLEIELNALCSKEKSRKTEIAEREIEIADLKNDLSALSQKNNNLEEEISTAKAEYSKLYENVSAQESELDDYNSVKIPELNEKSENLKQEINQHKNFYARDIEAYNNLEIELNALYSNEKSKKTAIAEREIEIADLKNNISVLSQKNNNLEEEISTAKVEYSKLCESVSAQENELSDYSSVKIPELNDKTENLKQKIDRHKNIYADGEKKLNSLETELNVLYSKEKAKKTEIAEREIEISDLKNNLSALSEKNNTLEEAISTVKVEYGKLCESVSAQENELSDYSSVKIPELNEKSESIKQEIERYKSIYADDLERYNSLENELTLLCSNEKAKKAEIAEKEIEISNLNEKLSVLDGQRKNVEDEISRLDKEKQKLIGDIQELRKQLEIYDVQTLKDMLDEKNTEIKAKQEECDRINTEIGEQQQKLVNLSEDFMNKKKMKENLIWECDSRISEIKSKIEDFDRQLREYEEEKSAIILRSNQREKELYELESWFKSLEVTNYKENIAKCEKAIEIMKRAMKELALETGLENLLNADARRSLNEYKRYFRDSIGDIEQRLKEYQRSYRKVVDVIGNGGTVI